jgi:hypothetical protein
MAMPQDPNAMAAMVDQIAARQMGAAPTAPPEPSAPAGAEAQAKPKKDSAEDKASAKGSPDTEGDKMAADAIIYEIEFGSEDKSEKRKLTPQQIKSTFERYSAMNYKNAQLKPVTDLIEQIMRDNPGVSSKELADRMQAIYKAQETNPTMGNTEGRKSGDMKSQGGDLESMLKKWEDENAASLPPGYKDMLMAGSQSTMAMQQKMAQMEQMLGAVLAQTRGVADASRDTMQQSQQNNIQAVRQQIGNNIDRAQSALRLPDDRANDFMIFAAERGYTMEDFVDPNLTIKVMQDFRNSMDSPEMERMRGIAQRRQAFTGSLGATPSAGEAPAEDASAATFDRLVNRGMNRMNM